jgi:hypothetical protein
MSAGMASEKQIDYLLIDADKITAQKGNLRLIIQSALLEST